MSRQEPFYQRSSFIYLFAMIASAILSLWVNSRYTVINPDAICYLYSAEELGKSGLHGAMHICPQAGWPFYSTMIYGVVKFTQLSYANAAYILDAIFSLISVVAFIAIVKELGGARRVLWFAAFVILLAHEFNSVRQYIIRDHGFWAFYLVSVVFLLRYFRDPKWVNAISWSGSLLIATLFRIEGAMFLLVLPLLSWFAAHETWKQRALHFITLYFPVLIICSVIIGWLVAHPQQTMDQLGRVSEVKNQLQHGLIIMFERYQTTKAAVSQNVLNHMSMRDANIVVALTFLSWYLVNVINNLSWIFAVLVLFAWLTRSAQWKRSAFLVIMGYLFVNLAVTLGFFAENLFLAKRYLIALTLILMLWVPFALEKLSSIRIGFYAQLAWVFILITALGGIFEFGHSKTYIRRAGDWLALNVPANASLYSNDYQLMYYSNHFGTDIFKKVHEFTDVQTIAQGKWKNYDFLALLMSRNEADKTAMVMQEIHLVPLQVFVSKTGDHVYIYKISHGEKKS